MRTYVGIILLAKALNHEMDALKGPRKSDLLWFDKLKSWFLRFPTYLPTYLSLRFNGLPIFLLFLLCTNLQTKHALMQSWHFFGLQSRLLTELLLLLNHHNVRFRGEVITRYLNATVGKPFCRLCESLWLIILFFIPKSSNLNFTLSVNFFQSLGASTYVNLS